MYVADPVEEKSYEELLHSYLEILSFNIFQDFRMRF